MTMPEKIWIDETSEDDDGFILGRFDQKYGNVDQRYIRADIADELARALELFMMSAHDYQTGLQEGEDALARYHTATEGK